LPFGKTTKLCFQMAKQRDLLFSRSVLWSSPQDIMKDTAVSTKKANAKCLNLITMQKCFRAVSSSTKHQARNLAIYCHIFVA